FDEAPLERLVRPAEDQAPQAPENPEFKPAIGNQTNPATPTLAAKSTKNITATPPFSTRPTPTPNPVTHTVPTSTK
ncbi:hypothetical protein AAGG49_22470, partial [Stenotrophomonas maltophilia]